MSIRLLIIGPLPPPIGGATRVFSNLVNHLEADKRLSVEIYNLSRDMQKDGWWQQFIYALSLILYIIHKGHKFDVISFHANIRGRIYMGPVLYCLTRMLRRPLIMRAFGGGFVEQYQRLSKLHRWIMRRTYFQSEICLFQTKAMTNWFADLPIRRAVWFSNYTDDVGLRPETEYREVCRKLVFLGRIIENKGIEIILNASKKIPSDVTIDLFGPLESNYSAEDLNMRGGGKVHYLGKLNQIEVAKTLWDYDALVLPTYHDAEGYPGVILEAYAHGIPVICTDWLAISEIVYHEHTGLLIQPHNVDAFVNAIKRLHQDITLYKNLQIGARMQVARFSSELWMEEFITLCYKVIN